MFQICQEQMQTHFDWFIQQKGLRRYFNGTINEMLSWAEDFHDVPLFVEWNNGETVEIGRIFYGSFHSNNFLN